MDCVNLGNTNLKQSRLCLGWMSFGEHDRGTPYAWTLDEVH